MDVHDNERFLVYAASLASLWLSTNDDDYPLDCVATRGWIAPLGFPRTSYWAKFESKDELWGRIRMLGQLVGAESLKGTTDTGDVEIHLT